MRFGALDLDLAGFFEGRDLRDLREEVEELFVEEGKVELRAGEGKREFGLDIDTVEKRGVKNIDQ